MVSVNGKGQLLFTDEQPQATGRVDAVNCNVYKSIVEYLEHFSVYYKSRPNLLDRCIQLRTSPLFHAVYYCYAPTL